MDNCPPLEKGKTRDKVAAHTGLNGKTFERGDKVVAAIDDLREAGREEDAEVLSSVLNRSVSGALKAVFSRCLLKSFARFSLLKRNKPATGFPARANNQYDTIINSLVYKTG